MDLNGVGKADGLTLRLVNRVRMFCVICTQQRRGGEGLELVNQRPVHTPE